MEWLQVVGYPHYFVNSNYEVIGKKGLIKGPNVTLRRKDRRNLSIKHKRLFLLTVEGIDPYYAVGRNFDTFEIEGCLRLIDW